MPTLREELAALVPAARDRLDGVTLGPRLDRPGLVERIGDGVAFVRGLPEARLDELLLFEGGVHGVAITLGPDRIGCFLLGEGRGLRAGTRVDGTGEVVRVPVGDALLGRVVDALGAPLDGGPPIAAERRDPVERPAPSIIDRALVGAPLHTGVTVVDAAIPLGRGQRELIVGDRQIGKTALATDAILAQRDSDVVCVYAAVGQKDSSVNRVIDAVRRWGRPERCLFVVGEPAAPPGEQWLVPYAACTMAEHFRDRGRHALLVIDDLSRHAAVYRQLALLLRSPPGREAYPGDVFHVHARLLERAAQLSPERGGGSLTALPIAETEAGNLAAYIPTNLISITDGQIVLEPRLFHEGQKPAVNVGRSVSRVGGRAQPRSLLRLAESLRLEYAQFVELEIFTRFGAMVDERTHRRIERGRRIRAVLSQSAHAPLPLVLEVALLLALGEGVLDAIPLERIEAWKRACARALDERCAPERARIDAGGELDPATRASLLDAVRAVAERVAAGA